MRKTKITDLGDKKVTVKELTAEDILSLLDLADNGEDDILKDAEALIPLAVDMSLDELKKLAPSEIKEVWNDFKEVNADFLELIERLEITKTLGESIRKQLNEIFADLLKQGIAVPGSMDGVSS